MQEQWQNWADNIGSSHLLSKSNIYSISVDNIRFTSTDTMKNVGVVYDESISMTPIVNAMYKMAYYKIRNWSQVLQSLRPRAKKMSHFDPFACNAV